MEFIFLDVLVCWFWRVNYVSVSIIFVVICVLLGMVVSREEGTGVLPKRGVLFGLFVTVEEGLVNAADLN